MSAGDAARTRRLLSVFRERPLGLDGDRLEQRRQRLLPRLRAEVRASHVARKRSVWMRRATFALAVAAVVPLAVSIAGWRDGAPKTVATGGSIVVEELVGESALWSGTEPHPLVVGETLKQPVRGELRTAAAGWTRLRTEQGLSLALSGATSVDLAGLRGIEGERRVFLTRGELRCEVPKLGSGEQFVVVTPDARVVVHGTAFTVRVVSGAPSTTCVRVQHGTVSLVREGRRIVLNGGDAWGCDEPRVAAAPTAASQPKQAQAEPRVRRTLGARTAATKSDVREVASGTLAYETELLQHALAAERRGDRETARRNLRLLLNRYPGSPLAGEARQALERVSGHADGLD